MYSHFVTETLIEYLKSGSSEQLVSPQAIVQRLLKLPQPEQRSEEWYSMRKTMITASAAATLIPLQKKYMKEYLEKYNLLDDFKENPTRGCNPYSSRREFFLDKCGHRSFFGNEATRWGQKYEDVVQGVYSRDINEHIYNFGLIPHPYLNYLGASPDGISENGIMLEIKVPMRRKITGIPPMYYWIQVQLQLEVCQLDICDFVECKISEYFSEKQWKDDPHKLKGLILETGRDTYLYPPVHIHTVRDLLEWAQGYPDARKVYWKMDTYSVTRIYRDKKWFNRARSQFYKGYLELVTHQKDNGQSLLDERESKKPKSLDLTTKSQASQASRPALTPLFTSSGQTDSESDCE